MLLPAKGKTREVNKEGDVMEDEDGQIKKDKHHQCFMAVAVLPEKEMLKWEKVLSVEGNYYKEGEEI